MKPILEWYEELPEPIRSQAIANYDPEFYRDSMAESLVKAIGAGFNWEESPEKDDYWEEIYDLAESGDYDKTTPLEQALSDLTKTLVEVQESIEQVRKAIRNEK